MQSCYWIELLLHFDMANHWSRYMGFCTDLTDPQRLTIIIMIFFSLNIRQIIINRFLHGQFVRKRSVYRNTVVSCNNTRENHSYTNSVRDRPERKYSNKSTFCRGRSEMYRCRIAQICLFILRVSLCSECFETQPPFGFPR